MTGLTTQAVRILEARYLKKDAKGEVVETPDELFRRVAKDIAQAECAYGRPHEGYANQLLYEQQFYQVISDLEFLPNSPCLANAGNKLQQLSACFVIPVEDSLEGIFDAVKAAALIHKTGGGTGFSFTNIRPKNSVVQSTGQIASGPVDFMKVFDAATQAIKQGGMRRGANMGMLRVDHPDILEFIHTKDDGKTLQNFNISVLITDRFMDDLGRCGKDDHSGVYGVSDGHYCACMVWKEIVRSAHKTGDPGVVFIDRVNAGRANPIIGWKVGSTNPCGEQPLYDWDSCNLGSINLGKFVRFVPSDIPPTVVDWVGLKRVVHITVRFLDNVIDRNKYILPEIEEVTKNVRRIGLGVMGWHDMLIKLGIPYASEEAVRLAEEVSRFIQTEADEASEVLAKERGNFPLYGQSIYFHNDDAGMRNSTRTTIAPTGTISLIAGCSSGIEPLFALSYEHHGLEGRLEGTRVVNEVAQEYLEGKYGKTTARNMLEGVNIVKDSVVDTAQEISPSWHLRHQAAWQKHVDNAVSKTINLPNEASVEDIEEVYRKAYELGCLGVTVYRDGSKEGQVLTEGKEGEDGIGGRTEPTSVDVGVDGGNVRSYSPRPEVLNSKTYKQPTSFGNLYVTISELDGAPFEVFAVIGKAGSDVQAMTEAACRAASKLLQKVPVGARMDTAGELAEQWADIGGSSSNGFGTAKVRSIPDAISRVLRRYVGGRKDAGVGDISPPNNDGTARHDSGVRYVDICPECHSATLRHEEGCEVCEECGYSRC